MAFGRLGSVGAGFGHLGASPGGGVAAPAGGAALLTGEANGFAADFTYATDAQRVALKTAGTVVSSGLSFFTNAGTSSKWVYDINGTLVNVAAGSLAVDYDPVTHAAKGLLVEPQTTNYMQQSAIGKPGSAWTVQGATGTAGQPDPSGGSEALQVAITVNEAGNNVANNINSGLTPGTTYTASAWCKGTNGQQVFFNGISGAGGQTLVTFTGTWQRVSKTLVIGGTGTTVAFETYNRDGGAHLPNVTFQCWGAQFETGTVATSYIPTTSATVTRGADVVSVTPASINYSATVGSWWAEWSVPAVVTNGRIIGNTSASTPLLMGSNSVGLLDGTTLSKSLTWAVNTTHKAISAYASGDRAVTLNGAAVAADAGATTNLLAPGVAIYFGNGGSTPMLGWLRKTRYLPRRPTNGELVTMST